MYDCMYIGALVYWGDIDNRRARAGDPPVRYMCRI